MKEIYNYLIIYESLTEKAQDRGYMSWEKMKEHIGLFQANTIEECVDLALDKYKEKINEQAIKNNNN